jgi:hypothetical protein
VKSDIGVTIYAHNISTSGIYSNIVAVNEPIQLDALAISSIGVSDLLISDGISISALDTRNCSEFSKERNEMGPITDLNGGWFEENEIRWVFNHTCSPATNPLCKNYPQNYPIGDFTTKDTPGRYCFFAIARKYSADGNGKWSRLASDDIQVGNIWVYLVYPKPL